MLHVLVNSHISWKNAVIEVINNTFSKFCAYVQSSYKKDNKACGSDNEISWLCLDLIAVSNFLGGTSNGLFLGCNIISNYNSEKGRLIHLNNSTNVAVILCEPSSAFKRNQNVHEIKLLRLTSSNLVFSDHYYERSLHDIILHVYSGLIITLGKLAPFLFLLSKDYLAMIFVDSHFQQKSLLSLLSPVEVLIFYRLLFCVYYFQTDYSGNLKFNANNYPDLEKLIQDFLTGIDSNSMYSQFQRGNRAISQSGETCDSDSSVCANRLGIENVVTLRNLWFRNLQSFVFVSSSSYDTVHKQDQSHLITFPLEHDEVHFFDFMHKFIGLQYEKYIRKSFYQNGLFHRLLFDHSFHVDLDEFGTELSVVSGNINCFGEEGCQQIVTCYKTILQDNHQLNIDSRFYLETLTFYSYSRSQLQKLCLMIAPVLLGVGDNSQNLTINEVLLWIALRRVTYMNPEYKATMFVNFNKHSTLPTGPAKNVNNENIARWRTLARSFLAGSKEAIKVTNLMLGAIRYSMSHLLQDKNYSLHTVDNSSQSLLVDTNLFDTLISNMYFWLEICYQEISIETFQTIILLLLQSTFEIIEISKIVYDVSNLELNLTVYGSMELKNLQLCSFAVRILIARLIGADKEHNPVTREMGLFFNSKIYLLVRERAQLEIAKYSPPNNLQYSLRYSNYTVNMVANLELLQRVCSATRTVEFKAFKFYSVVTKVPIVTVMESIVEIDMEDCFLCAVECFNKVESKFAQNVITPEQFVCIEVALAEGSIESNSSDDVFEVIYFGNGKKLTQAHLFPNTAYSVKCRCYFNGVPFLWSNLIHFRTLPDVLFQFDRLKCGTDIEVSTDGLTATYNSDESWNTILGSRSFNSGVISWEIKVLQSSTQYIFIGVATSRVDLQTFLGGCSQGWGFIGEQVSI